MRHRAHARTAAGGRRRESPTRDPERSAQKRDRVIRPLRPDEAEALHRVSLPLAKKAAAFFRMSRSCSSVRTCRRRRRSSSRSSVVRPSRSWHLRSFPGPLGPKRSSVHESGGTPRCGQQGFVRHPQVNAAEQTIGLRRLVPTGIRKAQWRIHSACVLRAAPCRAIEEGPGPLVTDIGEVADLVDRAKTEPRSSRTSSAPRNTTRSVIGGSHWGNTRAPHQASAATTVRATGPG